MAAVFAVGERLKARMPRASYAEQLEYLSWVGDVLERVIASSSCPRSRRDGARQLALLRHAQARLAAEAQEAARGVVGRFDAQSRGEGLRVGETGE